MHYRQKLYRNPLSNRRVWYLGQNNPRFEELTQKPSDEDFSWVVKVSLKLYTERARLKFISLTTWDLNWTLVFGFSWPLLKSASWIHISPHFKHTVECDCILWQMDTLTATVLLAELIYIFETFELEVRLCFHKRMLCNNSCAEN